MRKIRDERAGSAPGHTAERPEQDFTLFLTETTTPPALILVKGMLKGSTDLFPRQKNSGRRQRGGGMEEEGRTVGVSLAEPWERFSNVASLWRHYHPHFPDEEGEAQPSEGLIQGHRASRH